MNKVIDFAQYMKPTKIYLIFLFAISITFSVIVSALERPNIIMEHKENSKLSIDYSDIDRLFNIAVFDVGRSVREKAKPIRASIGTRLKSSRNLYTALEANRFLYKPFKKIENKTVLIDIRDSLQSIPEEVPLNMFNKREQLAYWLNLYNITLLTQLVEIYPKSSIGDYLYGENSILEKKLLKVSGNTLSLNDIQYNIVYPQFGYQPTLMYGFFQGIIGGPNIRTTAYTGEQVFSQLDSNAEEYINSNRGTYKGRKGVMRVSNIYLRNNQLFPDFDKDLKKHLLAYVDGDYEEYVKNVVIFKADIRDMHISDIRAGTRNFGGSAAVNSAAILDSAGYNNQSGGNGREGRNSGIAAINPGYISEYMTNETKSYGIYSVDEVEILARLKNNSRVKAGKVLIQENKK